MQVTLAGWTKRVTGRAAMAVGGVGLDKDFYSSLAERTSSSGNGFDNIDLLRGFLQSGEFDLIGVGRSLIAVPTWPRKARERLPFAPYDVEMLATLY